MFLLTIISSIFIALKGEKIKNIYPVFFVIGGLASFFDFLTVPIISLGFPLIIYFLILQEKRKIDWKETIKIIAISSITWVLGYGLIWITKWVIVDLVYNKGIIKTSIEQFIYRSGTHNADGDAYTYAETLYRNMILFIGIPPLYLFYLLIVSLVDFIINMIKKIKIRQNLINALPYAIILLMPFVWYFVLRNHSFRHVYFTYRDLLLFCTGFPLVLQKIMEREKVKKIEEKKE